MQPSAHVFIIRSANEILSLNITLNKLSIKLIEFLMNKSLAKAHIRAHDTKSFLTITTLV